MAAPWVHPFLLEKCHSSFLLKTMFVKTRKFATELEVIGALDIARGREFVIPVPSKGLLQRNR